jgi:hypothetical protein
MSIQTIARNSQALREFAVAEGYVKLDAAKPDMPDKSGKHDTIDLEKYRAAKSRTGGNRE